MKRGIFIAEGIFLLIRVQILRHLPIYLDSDVQYLIYNYNIIQLFSMEYQCVLTEILDPAIKVYQISFTIL